MIATLIIIVSLLRDFRWPRKKNSEKIVCVQNVLPVTELDQQDNPTRRAQVVTEPFICQATTTTGGKMQQGDSDDEQVGHLPVERNKASGSGSDSPGHPVGNEKRSSEASTISTSVSTEQTQIDATLGSTSSGTLPSASSPLTPSGQQLSVQHQQLSSDSNNQPTMMTASSVSSTLNNSTGTTNLRGYRHEHHLLSNSSTDTISALYNMSSHSEGGYGNHTMSAGTTTTGSASHSGVVTYPFKIRGDSTASTLSTSACSEVLLPPDGRRSSEGARLMGHRRSSGRLRRYIPRTTISSGGRRRTTGRYWNYVWE